jgi:hypothetical protein
VDFSRYSVLLSSVLLASVSALAQDRHTASRPIQPTLYGMMTGTATGVGAYSQREFPGGKNLGITAGLTVDFRTLGPFRLGADVRGTYPVSDGQILSERNILGGARLAYETGGYHAIRPYFDGHFGRGQMNYNKGYQVGNLLYAQTATNVYGGGGGVELDVSDQFSVKVDAQAQHWNTPVILPNKSTWSTQVSIGVAYRLFANKGPR